MIIQKKNIYIYIDNGKDDSQSIKLIRFLYNKENEIKFLLEIFVDSAVDLIYRYPTTDFLELDDILQYQTCVDFVKSLKDKKKDDELLKKLRQQLSKMTENSDDRKEEKPKKEKKNKKKKKKA